MSQYTAFDRTPPGGLQPAPGSLTGPFLLAATTSPSSITPPEAVTPSSLVPIAYTTSLNAGGHPTTTTTYVVQQGYSAASYQPVPSETPPSAPPYVAVSHAPGYAYAAAVPIHHHHHQHHPPEHVTPTHSHVHYAPVPIAPMHHHQQQQYPHQATSAFGGVFHATSAPPPPPVPSMSLPPAYLSVATQPAYTDASGAQLIYATQVGPPVPTTSFPQPQPHHAHAYHHHHHHHPIGGGGGGGSAAPTPTAISFLPFTAVDHAAYAASLPASATASFVEPTAGAAGGMYAQQMPPGHLHAVAPQQLHQVHQVLPPSHPGYSGGGGHAPSHHLSSQPSLFTSSDGYPGFSAEVLPDPHQLQQGRLSRPMTRVPSGSTTGLMHHAASSGTDTSGATTAHALHPMIMGGYSSHPTPTLLPPHPGFVLKPSHSVVSLDPVSTPMSTSRIGEFSAMDLITASNAPSTNHPGPRALHHYHAAQMTGPHHNASPMNAPGQQHRAAQRGAGGASSGPPPYHPGGSAMHHHGAQPAAATASPDAPSSTVSVSPSSPQNPPASPVAQGRATDVNPTDAAPADTTSSASKEAVLASMSNMGHFVGRLSMHPPGAAPPSIATGIPNIASRLATQPETPSGEGGTGVALPEIINQPKTLPNGRLDVFVSLDDQQNAYAAGRGAASGGPDVGGAVYNPSMAEFSASASALDPPPST